MNFRVIILSLFLLLPLVPVKARVQGEREEVEGCGTCEREINAAATLNGGGVDAFQVIFRLTDEERAQVDSGRVVVFDIGVKERKPSFDNGDFFEFARWIGEHLVYPEEAEKAGLEGRVWVSVKINEKGKLVNPVIFKSTNNIFEEEALRVIRSAPDKWKPGLNAKGEPISVSLLIPVNFNLPNK